MNTLCAKVEKRLKRLPAATRMEADNHIKTPAERAQSPERPVLLSLKNVRRSHSVAILKPPRRFSFDMPMHHAGATAGNNRSAGEVRGYRLTERVVKRLGQAVCGILRECVHDKLHMTKALSLDRHRNPFLHRDIPLGYTPPESPPPHSRLPSANDHVPTAPSGRHP